MHILCPSISTVCYVVAMWRVSLLLLSSRCCDMIGYLLLLKFLLWNSGGLSYECIISGFMALCCIASTWLRADVWYTISCSDIKSPSFPMPSFLAQRKICAHRNKGYQYVNSAIAAKMLQNKESFDHLIISGFKENEHCILTVWNKHIWIVLRCDSSHHVGRFSFKRFLKRNYNFNRGTFLQLIN